MIFIACVGMATKDGELFCPFGVMGGFMQPQGINGNLSSVAIALKKMCDNRTRSSTVEYD